MDVFVCQDSCDNGVAVITSCAVMYSISLQHRLLFREIYFGQTEKNAPRTGAVEVEKKED